MNGNGTKVGTSITLKVMAGDSYNIRANSWYRLNGATPATPISPISSIIANLVNGVSAASGGKATIAALQSGIVLDPAVTNFLGTQTVDPNKPKAYLNWILLDEQFKYAGGSFEQVGGNEAFKTFVKKSLPITKNGYLYVYVSNETPNVDVFFDNVQVSHVRGPLLEETHYYPFGLTMAGISSKAANTLENRKLYNGIEHTTDLELNHYDAFFRTLDPQIGRFMQIDPETDNQENASPYESMGNNPISNIDPLGDFKTRFGAWWHSLWHGGKVGKNTEGEYYVSKATTIESSTDGSVTVGVSVTYGKGRHALSAAGERMQAENNKQAYEDRMINLGVWQRHETVAQANEATFKNSVSVLLPNVVKGSTGIINTTKPVTNSQNIISRAINLGQQGKHIVGHSNYQPGKSILSGNAQELLDAFHSGNIHSSQTINTVKTRVDFGRAIGNYKNPETGQLVPTTKGIIHNGKNGAHIVPSSPN